MLESKTKNIMFTRFILSEGSTLQIPGTTYIIFQS